MSDKTIQPRERDLYRQRDELRAEVERIQNLIAGSEQRAQEAEAEVERLQLALYEIERMPFGFEAEVHAIALAALTRPKE